MEILKLLSYIIEVLILLITSKCVTVLITLWLFRKITSKWNLFLLLNLYAPLRVWKTFGNFKTFTFMLFIEFLGNTIFHFFHPCNYNTRLEKSIEMMLGKGGSSNSCQSSKSFIFNNIKKSITNEKTSTAANDCISLSNLRAADLCDEHRVEKLCATVQNSISLHSDSFLPNRLIGSLGIRPGRMTTCTAYNFCQFERRLKN